MDYWGESQSALAQGRFEPPTCQSTAEHANHQTMMTAPSRRINYCTPGPHSSTGGSSAKTAAPCVGHHQGASTFETKNIVNDCLKKLNTGEGRGAQVVPPPPPPPHTHTILDRLSQFFKFPSTAISNKGVRFICSQKR